VFEGQDFLDFMYDSGTCENPQDALVIGFKMLEVGIIAPALTPEQLFGSEPIDKPPSMPSHLHPYTLISPLNPQTLYRFSLDEDMGEQDVMVEGLINLKRSKLRSGPIFLKLYRDRFGY